MGAVTPATAVPPARGAEARRTRRFGLRSRIAVFMSALVLLSWLGFALVLAPSMRDSFRLVEERKISLYAQLVSMQMDHTLAAALAELEACAELPGVRRLEPGELASELARLDHTSQFFLYFTVLDRDGRLVARPSKPERLGADRSDRAYFVVPKQHGRTALTEVEVSTAGNLSLVVGTPILDTGGQFGGVLAGSLGLMDRNGELYRLITRPVDQDGPVEVLLFSREGALIASSVTAGEGEASNLSAGSAGAKSSPMTSGDERRWITSSATVPSTGWRVVVRVPESVVLAQAAGIGRKATMIALVLLVLVGLIGLVVAERFARPLERLSSALATYGHDGNSADVEVSGSGEMRAALEAFNAMQQERARAAIERERVAQQMLHAQKLQTVGTLAGGIAHDFNNLLTPILWGSGRLARDLTADTIRGPIAADIETSAELARDLIARILAFSRASESRRVPVAIAGVVDDAVRLARVSLPHGIRLETDLDRSAGVVLADSTQLHQVILNLCRNAIDAMDDAGTLRISLARGDAGTVVLRVSDTGAGMPPEVRERVFEPFFTTKPPGQGTGLGLSVVHGIVAQHEGSLSITSEVGCGTSVQVTLPLSAMAPAAPDPPGCAPGGAERILVVDDSPLVATAQARALRELGYQVESVTVPHEAIDRLAAGERFDLIVCDHNMPDLSGLQVADAILAANPDQRLLILTGNIDAELRTSYAALGVSNIAGKPLSFEQLADAVRAALDGGGRVNAPPESHLLVIR